MMNVENRRRVALWLRVSKSEEDLNNQLLALESFVAARGWEIVTIYRTEASAYTGAHHAALEEVYRDAYEGKWQVLVVWALDRLSREGVHAIFGVVLRLEAAGVHLCSYQQPWLDMRGPARELLLSVAGWIAQQESERISERTKAGLARRKAQGLPVGRQPGAKDKQRRRRSGQVLRREMERAAKEGKLGSALGKGVKREGG